MLKKISPLEVFLQMLKLFSKKTPFALFVRVLVLRLNWEETNFDVPHYFFGVLEQKLTRIFLASSKIIPCSFTMSPFLKFFTSIVMLHSFRSGTDSDFMTLNLHSFKGKFENYGLMIHATISTHSPRSWLPSKTQSESTAFWFWMTFERENIFLAIFVFSKNR